MLIKMNNFGDIKSDSKAESSLLNKDLTLLYCK